MESMDQIERKQSVSYIINTGNNQGAHSIQYILCECA